MSDKIKEELEAANKRLQILRWHQDVLETEINELEAELEAAFDDEAVLIKDIEKMERYLKEQS